MSTTLRFIFLLGLILCGQAHSRIITRQSPSSTSSSDLVSDGVRRQPEPTYLRFNPFSSGAESTCEPTYGFIPCTTTILGNLFLFIVYGYLMFSAATYISDGSELLLEILGPGIVGGLLLPALGSLPDAILILVSGLSGSKETAQSQVTVGMGLLAGSTIMLLTVVWGTCVLVGKCDLEGEFAKDSQDTKGFSLTGSGVSTDIWTSYAARIMAVSILPFLIVQLPQLLNTNFGRHLVVLIGLIVSVSLFVSYCLYQVFQPWVQKRRLDYVKHKHVISGILQHLKQHANALGRLLDDEGEPNTEVIKKLFQTIDENNDGFLSASELRTLIIGFRLEEIDLDKNDAVEKLMKDFDTIISDSQIDLNEFIAGITRWLNVAKRAVDISADPGHQKMNFLTDFHVRTKQEHDLLAVGNQSDEAAEGAKWKTIKAVLMLMLGTAIAAVFADPLVDVVDNFSDATSIPTFFISFIALPLATSSEAVSAIIFASRKKKTTASLTFSALYGSVTMNNVLCLSVFLALVYFRGLTWDFSSEVLVILIVCIIMGLLGSFRTSFPLWTSFVAFLLYPFSLVLVYDLDHFFGWS